jgi:predicted AAA+ superfamily ATPase
VDEERLKYVLREAELLPLPEIRPRALQVPLASGRVVVLTGIRRSGKTFLLYDALRRLLASGVNRGQVILLSYEDDRLQPIRPGDHDRILRAHAELHPELAGQPRYLLLDEVQAGPGWERYVRRLHDTRAASVLLTGSSSSVLAKGIATALRGRCLSYEVFPLSFSEYLGFRGIEVARYDVASEARVRRALEDYLDTGGLPEIVLAPEALRLSMLREYVDLVFYRDLVERHRVANAEALRAVLHQALGSPASTLSPHKLYRDLRSRGLTVGKDTLYRYVRVLEETLLVHLVPVAVRSLRRRAMLPKKLHLVDWALGRVVRPTALLDRGRRLENAVFLHHRREREDLGYLAGPAEVDLTVGVEEPEAWVHTCWSVSEDAAWARELRAMTRPGAPASNILVVHEATDRQPPPGARIVEAWRHLI